VPRQESGAGGARGARAPLGETVIAAAVLVLAGVVFWQTATIPTSPIYATVPPTLFPAIVALGLAVLGLLLMLEARRGGWQSQAERSSSIDRAALTWIAAGLVLNVALIGPAGFTLASTVLFVCVARGFGSGAIVRDSAVALVLALAAYFGFAKTLGIDIGSGLIENAIEAILGIGPRGA
jgi:putative tricarboxylic transport membrane protein